MAKTDHSNLIVHSDEAPSFAMPNYIFGYESRTFDVTSVVNSGRPVANSITIRVFPSFSDAEDEENELTAANYSNYYSVAGTTYISGVPTVSLVDSLPSSPDIQRNVTMRVVAPTISTNRRLALFYVRVDIASTGNTDATRNASSFDIKTLHIDSSISPTVSADDNYDIYENASQSLQFSFLPGVPTINRLEFSWHNNATDAANGSNPITTGVPSATLRYTDVDTLSRRSVVASETGYIDFTSPSVTAATTLYGRIAAIDRHSNVVASDSFTVSIENNLEHTITVGSFEGIEGSTISIPFSYISGSPTADSFRNRFFSSSTDAQGETNELTTGIPTNVVFSPTSPASGTGRLNGTISMTLPLVSEDTEFAVRTDLIQGTNIVRAIWFLEVLDRVESEINFNEDLEMNERTTKIFTGTYKTGIPSATAFSAKVYPNESDAENDVNELIGTANPLAITFNPTTPVTTGDRTMERTVSAQIVVEDVGDDDEDFGIIWGITQETFTDTD